MPAHATSFAVTNTASWLYGTMTVILLGLLTLVVVGVPSVLDVLGFVGGLAGVALMFVFPAALYIRVFRQTDAQPRMSSLRFYFDMFMFCIFSVLGFIAV